MKRYISICVNVITVNLADAIGHRIGNPVKRVLKLSFLTIRETERNYRYQMKNFQCVLKINTAKEKKNSDNIEKNVFTDKEIKMLKVKTPRKQNMNH